MTAFELHLELKALRNEMRLLVILALVGGQSAARVDLPGAVTQAVSSVASFIL